MNNKGGKRGKKVVVSSGNPEGKEQESKKLEKIEEEKNSSAE